MLPATHAAEVVRVPGTALAIPCSQEGHRILVADTVVVGACVHALEAYRQLCVVYWEGHQAEHQRPSLRAFVQKPFY